MTDDIDLAEPPTPAPELPRLEIRRALRIWTIDGCVATAQGTLTMGAFLTGFALYLGADNLVMGVIAGIPAFVGLLQLFSSYFAQRYGNRKQIVAWSSLLGRLLWIPTLLIPFLLPKSAWVPTFIILTLLYNAFMNVSAPLWTAWVSDLVPADYRGRYFGQRNMYAGLVGMGVSVTGGAFLDLATKRQMMSEPMAFAILFGIASLFGFGSFALAQRSPDVPGANARAVIDVEQSGLHDLLSYFSTPFADTNFRRFMIYYGSFVAATTIAAQFFTVYQFTVLQLNYTALQLLAAVANLSTLAMMPVWGYLSDKYGNKPILIICSFLVLIPPMMWNLTYADHIPGLWTHGIHGKLLISYTKLDIIALNLIAGMGWSGIAVTQFNLMIGGAPSEKRTVYVSAFSAVAGIVGGIFPLVGGAILVALAHVHFPAHGLVRNGYHVLFILTMLMRASCILLVRPVVEKGSNTAKYVIEQLKATKPIASFTNIKNLSRGNNVAARQQAAENLAKIRTPVAVEELVRALEDVSLPVRERAAAALGEIGDARAVGPLVGKLTDPSSGIANAAATALGKIGSLTALPSLAAAAQLGPTQRRLAALEALGHLADSRVSNLLMSLCNDPDPSVRYAAIRALNEGDDPNSAPALIQQLEQERDPATIAMLADALGRWGNMEAIGALLSALERNTAATVRGGIVNAIGSIVSGSDSFYPYLALDAYARDEVVSKLLLNIQRRFRSKAAHHTAKGASRLAVHIKRALEFYISGEYNRCLECLCLIAQALSVEPEYSERDQAASFVVLHLGRRYADPSGTEASLEEVLLAMFLVRQLVPA